MHGTLSSEGNRSGEGFPSEKDLVLEHDLHVYSVYFMLREISLNPSFLRGGSLGYVWLNFAVLKKFFFNLIKGVRL